MTPDGPFQPHPSQKPQNTESSSEEPTEKLPHFPEHHTIPKITLSLVKPNNSSTQIHSVVFRTQRCSSQASPELTLALVPPLLQSQAPGTLPAPGGRSVPQEVPPSFYR